MLTRNMARPAPTVSPEHRILAAVRAVSCGQVASYGAIARRAGLPGRARLVARILGQNDDPALPWHRILRADGRIAFPPDAPGFAEQARRLVAEGVAVRSGRVRLPAEPEDVDAAVWGPR